MQTANVNLPVEDLYVSPRDSMRILPQRMQGFLTRLTGKPYTGQQQRLVFSNRYHLITAYLYLFIGISLSMLAHQTGYSLLYPAGWLLAVSGARKIMTTLNHYCVHQDLFRKNGKGLDTAWHHYLAEFNCSILFLQDFKAYKEEHTTHHRVRVIASAIDPDMAFMYALGFKPGMSRRRLWWILALNLFFPFSRLHLLFMWSRLKTVLFRGNWFRYLIMGVTATILFMLGLHYSFGFVFWSVLFPMTYLYHMAALLQFSSEHSWLKEVDEAGNIPADAPKADLVNRSKRLTAGRMMGEAIPDLRGRSGLYKGTRLVWWTARMLLIHLPLRLFVLPGDLVQHDMHHRSRRGMDWANPAFTRQTMIDGLPPGEPAFVDVWGLWNMITLVFEGLSNSPPIKVPRAVIDLETIMAM